MHEQTPPIVHRDVKPENWLLSSARGLSSILAGSSGSVLQLCDFGTAVRLTDAQPRAGMAGTLSYMAPEVSARKGATVMVESRQSPEHGIGKHLS